MKKIARPVLLAGLVVAAFALGLAVSSVGRQRPRAEARTFLDEMSAINAEHCARLDEAMKERGYDETCQEVCRAGRVHYDEAVRECYRRHGKPLPPHLR